MSLGYIHRYLCQFSHLRLQKKCSFNMNRIKAKARGLLVLNGYHFTFTQKIAV